MMNCWDKNPTNRPFYDIIKVNVKRIYDNIKETATDCLNISIEKSSSRYSTVDPELADIKPFPTYNDTPIFIKGSNGKFMSGENGLRPLKCDRKEVNNWEMFTVKNFGNKIIALESRGNYVSSENGEKPVTCDRKIITDLEKFKWIDNADATFSVKGNNGKFLTRDNGEGLMICDREICGIFEKFTFINYFDLAFVDNSDDSTAYNNIHIFIKGSNGKYVCSEDGYDPMKCDRQNPDGWERFNIEDLGDGIIAIKCNGKYVTSEIGERPMWCNRATINDWEKFEIINHSDDKTFSLKGGNGCYVTVSADENQLLFCNGKSLEEAEKFSFCL
uniref:Fascin domain-containing protein n=1 Tax=Panagrolaimus sp. ES5 TaxID=591445 RepID=A0AC34GN53_9BILA